jgi:rod shape-determining protein MreC
MQRAKSILPIFLLFIVLSLLLFFFRNPLTGVLQNITLPIQKWVFQTYSPTHRILSPQEKLTEENNALRTQLAQTKELERDNKALRDQFELANPSPRTLVPADVIGANEDILILDRGDADKITQGDIVVLKDNLLGKITKVTPHISVVTLISHPSTSFTAQTVKTQANGVIKSQGGDTITLNNVVLSDKLEKDDIILTKGDVDQKGFGFPPKLVVGKIISVNKKASDLFQQAQVRSLVDLTNVRMVFVKTKD